MAGSVTEEPDPRVPRRVLVVSASIGAGHDAVGAALQEQVERRWPGSQVEWVDVLGRLGALGRVSHPAFTTALTAAPWLYEYFYTALWRHPWFAQASIWSCGAVAGQRLAPVVERVDPDLIVSTHPIGTAGLAWLRQYRGLTVPIGAWLADFAPHPFWIHPGIDLNLVSHPALVPVAHAAAPGAPVTVCGPPVAEQYQPGDRAAARRRSGLSETGAVILVAGGSLGPGAMVETVQALTGALPDAQVVAVCGTNQQLARQLAALGLPPRQLRVLGWVAHPADLLQAADLLITNGSGATTHEALATGTPMLVYRPLAGHGSAAAAMLAACGLAEVCRTLTELITWARTRLAAGAPAAPLPRRPYLGLADVAALTPPEPAGRRVRAWPMRAQDALFRYVETATVAQQIGAVIEVGPRASDGAPLGRDELVALLRERLPVLPALRRQPVSRGPGRRPGWRLLTRVDPAAHVQEHCLPPGADRTVAIDRFWSQALPGDRPPWQMLVLNGLPAGAATVVVKLHHSLGDGRSAIGVLLRLLEPLSPAAPTRASPAGSPSASPGLRDRIQSAVSQSAQVVRGLARLAVAGPAPGTELNRPLATPQRRLLTAELPAAEVSRVARAYSVHPSELVAGLVAGALHRAWPGPGEPPRSLRALFPVAQRERAETQGNWTGAVSLDLPLSPMPTAARVAAVRARLRRGLAGGQPVAAALVLRALGALPARLHAAAARQIYTGRFMNVIVSYLGTNAAPQWLAGAPIRAVTPVVALADRVPVGVAALRIADRLGIGVLLDASLASTGRAFVTAVHEQFAELADLPPRPVEPPRGNRRRGHAGARIPERAG